MVNQIDLTIGKWEYVKQIIKQTPFLELFRDRVPITGFQYDYKVFWKNQLIFKSNDFEEVYNFIKTFEDEINVMVNKIKEIYK